jgi:hypothetical protein
MNAARSWDASSEGPFGGATAGARHRYEEVTMRPQAARRVRLEI